jgi:hypothetical protein
MIVEMQINLCPLPQKRPNLSIAAVRVVKSVSFVLTLMAVLLLAHAPPDAIADLLARRPMGVAALEELEVRRPKK